MHSERRLYLEKKVTKKYEKSMQMLALSVQTKKRPEFEIKVIPKSDEYVKSHIYIFRRVPTENGK